MAVPASPRALYRTLVSAFRVLALGLVIFPALTVHAAKWAAIDPAELAATKPQVDPEAGAEILLKEVTIEHVEIDAFVRSYYVRAKIYSTRGLDEFTKIELPYDDSVTIRDLAVRTIKPDGKSIELTKKDIYDRTAIKAGDVRVRMKSFAPAGVEVGSIVEYSYTEAAEGWKWYVPLSFQSSLPARVVRYRFQPYGGLINGTLFVRSIFLGYTGAPSKPDKDGRYTFEMKNVAAVKTEPLSPPELDSEASIIICYSTENAKTAEQYWANLGKDLHERMLKETKATKLVQTTLAGIISKEDSPEEKLRKIYDYCRTKITNRYSDTATFTSGQRAKLHAHETASDAIKAGYATGDEIDMVFVALARAAGFDARYVAGNNRNLILFNAKITEPFFVSDLLAAVQLNGQWLYFDPGVTYLPYATPYWSNAATSAVIAAPKNAAIVTIEGSPAEASKIQRKATFKLESDGTLEGDVTITYAGHPEVRMKHQLDGKTPAEREIFFRENLQEFLKLAEISDLKVENASDPLAPLHVTYHLRVPEYADRTGSRLFVQPAVFQKNRPPLFTDDQRRLPILFDYRMIETDEVHLLPPDGYELEQASAPSSMDLGPLGSFDVQITANRKTGELIYRRAYKLDAIYIAQKFYTPVRQLFTQIRENDGHTLTLKRKADPKDAPPAAPAPSTESAPAGISDNAKSS